METYETLEKSLKIIATVAYLRVNLLRTGLNLNSGCLLPFTVKVFKLQNAKPSKHNFSQLNTTESLKPSAIDVGMSEDDDFYVTYSKNLIRSNTKAKVTKLVVQK